MLVMLYNKSKAADHNPLPASKKVSVSFTEDVVKNELTIFLNSNNSKPVKLCFFSAEGKLVKQVSINNQQETIITDLKRGMYSYECFDNDLKIKSGKFILK